MPREILSLTRIIFVIIKDFSDCPKDLKCFSFDYSSNWTICDYSKFTRYVADHSTRMQIVANFSKSRMQIFLLLQEFFLMGSLICDSNCQRILSNRCQRSFGKLYYRIKKEYYHLIISCLFLFQISYSMQLVLL